MRQILAQCNHYLPLLFRVKLYDPLNPIFVAEHAEIGAPGTVCHGYFHLSAFRKALEEMVCFLFAGGTYRNLAAVFVFVGAPHAFGYVIAHQAASAYRQFDVHYFMGFVFRHCKAGTGHVFETNQPGKCPAEYGLVKGKCLFRIAVEVDVWVKLYHGFCR